jgi:ElaB/YqjD/DUF883 family membrane-anchored ribosome-binding protein
MTPATVETSKVETEPAIRERANDAARQMAHISHEAQLLKSLAADAIEDGVHAAKRAVKSVRRRAEGLGDEKVEGLGDVKDEAAYRVERQPFKALAIAIGLGLVFAIGMAWIGGRLGKEKSICGGS